MPYVPGVVFVSPPTVYAPPPTDPGRTNFIIWWEAWDGSNWSLSDEDSGLVMMRGVRGLGGITIEHHRDDHASLPGARWRSFRALTREIFLPVHIYSDGESEAWIEHNRAFSRTMRAGKQGWLHIIHPDGEHRRIGARYDKGLDDALEMDPSFFGWATYGIYLTAESPYWERVKPVTDTWRLPEPVYYFGGETTPGDYAPPYGISDEQTVESASITNPGDVPAWPKWIYRGPATSATVGIDGRTIDIPIALTAGQSVTIDMDPQEQTALREDGTDVTAQLSSFQFAPIPPGVAVPLDVQLVGSGGSIQLSFTPLYESGIA